MPDKPSHSLSDEALGFIVRLHSGEEAHATAAAFAAWRLQSSAHEAAAREAEAIWGDTADIRQDEPAGSVHPGRLHRGPGSGKLLSTIVLAGLAGWLFWATGSWTKWMADETTGVGQTRTITLSDGSRLTLNADSALDIAISDSRRKVKLLRGEVYFEVAADEARPFVVEIEGLAVTARGTAFDIDRFRGGDISVAVSQHAVELEPRTGQPIMLETGQMASIGSNGRIETVSPIDKAGVASWRDGLLTAEDRPFGEIVDQLRAYHRGWIIVRDPALARLRVNAVLDIRSPETALRTLEKGLPIRVRTISPFVILISPS